MAPKNILLHVGEIYENLHIKIYQEEINQYMSAENVFYKIIDYIHEDVQKINMQICKNMGKKFSNC